MAGLALFGEEDLIFGVKTGAYGGRLAFHTFAQQAYPWQPPCEDTGCQLGIGHEHDDCGRSNPLNGLTMSQEEANHKVPL